jgi:glycosyltransferase involved in cell wall biosynthesis
MCATDSLQVVSYLTRYGLYVCVVLVALVDMLIMKVHVVAHGVATDDVCGPPKEMVVPGVKQLPLGITTKKNFIFLYQSGALWRKGLDVLLDAFTSEFTSMDDVLLIVHSIYGDSAVVAHLDDLVAASLHNITAPHIVRMSTKLTNQEQALLRSAADVYVMPTRAEGFGLTIAEVMACGLPVITTDQGAHRDFVDENTAFLVKSTRAVCNRYVYVF